MISQIKQRLNLPTPEFFKKLLKKILIQLGTLTVLCSAPLIAYGDHLPHWATITLQVGVSVGIFSGILSTFLLNLPVKDPEQIEQSLQESKKNEP